MNKEAMFDEEKWLNVNFGVTSTVTEAKFSNFHRRRQTYALVFLMK